MPCNARSKADVGAVRRGAVAVLSLIACASLAACGDSQSDGAKPPAQARRVRGTERLSPWSEVGFSLSPDGAALLVELEREGALPRLAFLELNDERLAPIAWSPQAQEALLGAPLLTFGLACWSADSDTVIVRAEGGPLTASRSAAASEWSVWSDTAAAPVAAPRLPIEGLVRFEQRGGAICLHSVGAAARLLATHESSSRLRPEVLAPAGLASAAPSGQWTCYAVLEAGGALASAPRLFALSLAEPDAAPIELTSNLVGVPQWLPTQDVLLYLQAGPPSVRGLFVWTPLKSRR